MVHIQHDNYYFTLAQKIHFGFIVTLPLRHLKELF